jgi:hypothetical protein
VTDKTHLLHRVQGLSNGVVLQEKLNQSVITSMNITAVLLCEGKLLEAKNRLDALLQSLDLKVITIDTESKSILPSYLVNMLVYLLLKTSKYPRSAPVHYLIHSFVFRKL